jgi:hypothetical protein
MGIANWMSAAAVLDKPLASGLWRMAPLRGEMTQSFLGRLAAGYGMEFGSLLAAVVGVGGRSNTTGRPQPDSEVFLNRQARECVAALCQVPEEHLARALPAWAQEEPRKRYPAGSAAQFHRTPEMVRPWGPACPGCVARRARVAGYARLYLGPQDRLCWSHGFWLLQIPGTVGLVVDVSGYREAARAQRRHVGLLRQSPVGAAAFEVAQAVTASWWWRAWPQEHLWLARLRALRAGAMEWEMWRVVARELVTYPETVALAVVLADAGLRRRVAAGGRVPFRLGDVPALLAAVAGGLGRPWMVEGLAQQTSGPLFAWAYQCVRAGGEGEAGQPMWALAPAHRLRGVADELAEHAQSGQGGTKGKRRRGYSKKSDDAFAAGLAHAARYARDHGNLAVQKDAVVGSFKLGEWLSNQQVRGWAQAPERVRALEDLDPWWNPPWPMQWQRSYYRARDHAAVDGPPDAAAGFPGTQRLNGEWLHLQCTQYASLHPEQQRLLADIGITAAAARAAQPRRPSIWAGFETALERARSYVAENGHLAVSRKIVYKGYPLGTWVMSQRNKASKAVGPTVRSRALDAVDPWWNPPWPLAWQRTYARARRLVGNGHRLEPDRGFPGLDAELALWLSQQSTAHQALHPAQQQLLADIGLTAASGQIPIPASVAESGWKAAADPGGAAGMASARSFARAAGHLAVPHGHMHHGYPLGRWLAEQRGRDRRYQQAHGSLSPRGRLLAELDPWWNPPWHYTWQRHYQQARHEHREGRLVVPPPTDPADPRCGGKAAAWLRRQCARHDVLHPEQQNLLADIGITATLAHALSAGTRHQPVDTGLAHAGAYAAIHGNLAVPGSTRHNGFPLGAWLLRQRHRAAEGRTNPARIAALNALDPHWNPHWSLTWQRTYHRVQANTANGSPTPADQRWITTQTLLWDSLHPTQQQLLTPLGAGPAQALPAPAPTAARRYPTPAGLPHARTYAATYGNLAVPTPTQHNGFALGRWLLQQRRKARTGRLSPRTLQELATLDPWWNPPWPFNWQTTYHQHRTTHTTNQPIPPALQHWARKQTATWDQLHPHQPALLAATGITPQPVP